MRELNIYGWVALILVLVGGINWGLVGLFNVNLVTGIFGDMLGRLVFVLVGVSAGYLTFLLYKNKMKG